MPTTMPAAPDVPAVPAATQPSVEVPAAPAAPAVPAVPAAPAAPEATTPAAPAAPTADAVDPEATSLIGQAEDAVKNKKWDDASAALKKLDAMKDKLPQSLQDKIKSLEATVDGGKALSGIPGLGK